MTNALLTPFDLAAPTRTGRQMFRKQILKKGTINYKGQQITFDDPFLKDVVRSFNRGAYDQVPFVLADPKNRHNMDPERFRGEVKGLELTEDGLDMIVETTAEGAKTVQSNPRMGVSARIVQGLTKSDGRTYKRAIQHVLATMDPRLTGMRPWEAVDLSEEDGEGDDEVEVIDLTAASIKEGTRVANKTAKRAAAGSQTVQLDLSNMTDERFQELLDFVAQDGEESEDDGDSEDEDDDETVEEVTSKQTVKRKGFGKQVVEDVEDEDEDDEDDDSTTTRSRRRGGGGAGREEQEAREGLPLQPGGQGQEGQGQQVASPRAGAGWRTAGSASAATSSAQGSPRCSSTSPPRSSRSPTSSSSTCRRRARRASTRSSSSPSSSTRSRVSSTWPPRWATASAPRPTRSPRPARLLPPGTRSTARPEPDRPFEAR
jgi:hypothetical protein